jgi:hypothetical protein
MEKRPLDVVFQGVVAGFIGYVTVAVIFALANLLTGQSPFHTAAVLGAALFYGVTDPALVTVTPEYVFLFNGVHLMAFLVFGMAGAWLATLADRGEQLWYPAVFFFMLVAFHLIGAAQVLAIPMQEALSGVAIWAGGIVASVAMAVYLLKAHPGMRQAQAW